MLDIKNKQLADTFNTRVRTPWVWLVLAITVGLTALFYFSQKPQLVIYSRHLKSLTDYQLQEAFTMRGMERVRIGFGADSVFVQAQTMNLREMAVSFSREMDNIRGLGVKVPSYESVSRFEKEVLSKVAGMRRYTTGRMAWNHQLDGVRSQVMELEGSLHQKMVMSLDSMRAGYLVGLGSLSEDEIARLPQNLKTDFIKLSRENEELALAWSRFDNSMAAMYCEDMIQFFQSQNMDELSLKSRIPMAFYFLSLVLLLSTFFFIFRSKNID